MVQPLELRVQIKKEHFVSFTAARKNTVSALYREPTDSEFGKLGETETGVFTPQVLPEQVVQPKNSIKACVHDAQTVVGETGVRLRLLEPAKHLTVPSRRNDCNG